MNNSLNALQITAFFFIIFSGHSSLTPPGSDRNSPMSAISDRVPDLKDHGEYLSVENVGVDLSIVALY